MYDMAHVGLVNPHAESPCSHHYVSLTGHPVGLLLVALPWLHGSMVGRHTDLAHLQPFGNLLDLRHRCAVDDDGACGRAWLIEELDQFIQLILVLINGVCGVSQVVPPS
ncbi:hypothetical protein D3C85_1192540 [compost metagenome]